MGARAAAIGIATGLLALAPLAQADDDWKPTARLELDREAATTCPDAAALTDAVTGRLGYDPFVSSGGDLRILVHFTRNSSEVTGKVEAFDASGIPKGEKTIASKRGDCAEVAQSVTLTIALLLDPRSGLVARAPPSKPEPDPLAPVVDAAPTAAPPPAAPAAPSFVPRARAGVLGTVGAEPGPSVAARVAFGVAQRRWSVDAELRADLPREAAAAGKHATSGLLLGALVPCLRSGRFGGCAVVAVGALRSEVSSSSPPSVTSMNVAAGPRAAFTLPLGSTVALVLDVEALLAFTRTTVRVDGVDVWSPPLVSAGLGAALEVQFP